MIISISGSQGQGKTTTVHEIMSNNKKILSGAANIARTILNDWNKSLDDINLNIHLKMKFQDEIINRQYKIESELSPGEIYISERSYADIFAYALVNLGSFNKCSKWLNEYYGKCYEFQKIYKKIFFLTGREYIPENDGIRSINKLYGKMIEIMTYQYLMDFAEDNINQEIIKVNMPYTEDRVSTILARLSNI